MDFFGGIGFKVALIQCMRLSSFTGGGRVKVPFGALFQALTGT
jgi:hypothetical protein